MGMSIIQIISKETVEAEIKTDRALTGSWDNENPAERRPSNGPLRAQGKLQYTAT